MKKLTSKKGFTLIEMLVVIAIIAVLVAIVVPTVTSSTTKAKAATDAANLRTVAAEAAIQMLNNDGTLPSTYTFSISCKTDTGASLKIYKTATGDLEACFVNGTKYYTVATLSKVAEDGTSTAYTSAAPSNTIIYGKTV